jgi:hypothetical protein
MVGSAICFIGIIGTHIFDIYECRGLVHMAWGSFGIFYLGILAYTYAFFPLGSVTYEMCNFYK